MRPVTLAVEPGDHWILHEEKSIGYWSYPVRKTRSGKIKVDDLFYKGTYRIYEIQRRWYNTRTREFLIETEKLLSFNQELASGRAIWDHYERKMLLPNFTEEARV